MLREACHDTPCADLDDIPTPRSDTESTWCAKQELGWTDDTLEMQVSSRSDFKRIAARSLREMRVLFCTTGMFVGPSADGETSVILQSVDSDLLPYLVDAKNKLVYVCALDTVMDMLHQEGEFDLDGPGTLHVVTGQSPDVRSIRLKPLLGLEKHVRSEHFLGGPVRVERPCIASSTLRSLHEGGQRNVAREVFTI